LETHLLALFNISMSSITISKIPVHKAYFFHQWERPVLLTVLLSLISMQGYMKSH